MSGRVTSSGNMPAVCSNSVRRSSVSLVAEALGNAGQIPDRIDRDLHHRDAAIGVHDLAVGAQPLGRERLADLRQIEPRARHRDARADVDALGDLLAEILRDQMAPGIERDDASRDRSIAGTARWSRRETCW